MRQRHELIARIRQMRRGHAARDPAAAAEVASGDITLAGLEDRAAHLEKMVAGLQDSIHRESTRQHRELAELEARLDPAALEVALSGDARRRGL